MASLLPDWIWKDENRAVATFIGGSLAAAVAGLWTIFVFVYHPTPSDMGRSSEKAPFEAPSQRKKVLESQRLCNGDDPKKCPNGSLILKCGDIYDFMSAKCGGRYSFSPPVEREGGACGYQVVTFNCWEYR
jgi:hypothetical protein